MKKIIDGKVYNTETAKECGEYSNIPYVTDFHYYCETLYQKKTGEFFIFGEGNAASKYCKYIGTASTGGCRIVPLTYDEAREWAEDKLTADEYEAIFGEVNEDEEEGKTALHLYLESALIAKVKQEANKLGISVSEYIASLLR